MKMKRLLCAFIVTLLFTSCELYGKLGGADQTGTYYPGDAVFEEILSGMSGVWYSHYAGIGRLDGYRIGTWNDYNAVVKNRGKEALFPGLSAPYNLYPGSPAGNTAYSGSDYFLLYDDTVYGQSDGGSGGSGGWGALVTRYMGIVRAVNVFNGDKNRGAIIVQYFQGCAPTWDADIKNGQRPFFGRYSNSPYK